MEHIAQAFDQPLESHEHQSLASTAWMGGELVFTRYWLGRLLHRNFFRESDESVKEALQRYLVELGCKKGAPLAAYYQSWAPVTILIRHQVELIGGQFLTANPRLVAALEAVMADPDLNNSQVAAIAETTEKQIAQMTDVQVLRKLWMHRAT
jgi:hypothetical protein